MPLRNPALQWGPGKQGRRKPGVAPRKHGHHGRPGRKGSTKGRTGAKTLQPSGYYLTGDIAANEAGASRDPGADRLSAAIPGAGAPQPAREIDAPSLASSVDSGLLSAVLRLAGKGDLSGSALSTWQREQDRIANRAWRRPGGLQRMGGL